ncbi:MAG: hypothetical protein Q8N60_01005, partial [Candidatus Diapherotrites archaeon]|nr:hypothetical protein [Candidatus Diapherotrites archaeon]
NILDLRYQEQLQQLNAVLIFISVGVLGFVGSFIWQPDYLALGFVLSVIIVSIGYLLYQKTKNRMNEIISEIEKIKK